MTGNHHDDSAFPPVGPLAGAAPGELLLTGVRPYGEGEDVNVLIRDGVIAAIGADVEASDDDARVLD
ncbi:MAG TPA: dihydroorotase, partial [Corynebacterium xerosis]|nr:dihydroorotase [Corynebacterium xerosis]